MKGENDMGYYNKNLVSPQSPVYIEDEEEKILNEPNLLMPMIYLREIYKDFPADRVAEFLKCRQVGEIEYFGKSKIPLIRLECPSNSTGKVLDFCLYRAEGSPYWSLVKNGKGFEPVIRKG